MVDERDWGKMGRKMYLYSKEREKEWGTQHIGGGTQEKGHCTQTIE